MMQPPVPHLPTATPEQPAPAATRTPPATSPHNTRSRSRQGIVATVHAANLLIDPALAHHTTTPLDTRAPVSGMFWPANAMVDPATDNVLEYAQLRLGPDELNLP